MRIIGFVCEHGAGKAFQMAGEERIPLPPEVTLITLPCAGRVDPLHLLRAFREGADAVFVACCLEGNCHHVYGDVEAGKRVEQARAVLEAVGLGAGRLELFHLASNQGWRAAEAAEAMLARAKELGPNPLGVDG